MHVRGVVFRPEIGRVILGAAYQRLTGSPPLFPAGPVSWEILPQEGLPKPSWVRVRSRLAGICGTDLNLLRLKVSSTSASMARKRSIKRPFCIGHETVGEVIEVGSQVRKLTPGQRVVFVPGLNCNVLEGMPACEMCRRGLPLLCLHRDEFPAELAWGGGWSESFVRHESQLLPIPDEISDEKAVLVEPLACSVHAVLRCPPTPGDTVVVIGCGTIGLGIILTLRALSIPLRIIAIARHSYQSSQAESMGADRVLESDAIDIYDRLAAELETTVLGKRKTNRMLHHGARVVYDAVGNGMTLQHALRWVQPRGTVVLEGISPRPAPSDCTPVWLREVNLVGAHGHGLEHYGGRQIHAFDLVMEWIKEGRLSPEGLITHRYSLAEYKEAIRVAAGKSSSKAIKVLMEIQAND
jgi:threonine dehydrogenase-like Zn-dependent dehydrogenase